MQRYNYFPIVIQSEAKNLPRPCHSDDRKEEDELLRTLSEKSREHKVDVHEILPPFGRLNDKDGGNSSY